MPDLLLYGDTERSAAMRHEIPVPIGDPFLYAEAGGRRYVATSVLERDRIAAACPDIELLDNYELGFRELLEQGLTSDQMWLELAARAVERIGVREAFVDFDFPLGVAERLRADGVALTVDDERLKLRRRAKSEAELGGIKRSQRSAEAGMAAAAATLRRAEAVDGTLHLDGSPLLAEDVRATIRAACENAGVPVGPELIVASAWQGTGHDPGTGPLPAGLPITIDLWPQDEPTRCWADMTRTFVAGGEPPEETRRQERLVTEALRLVYAAVRPGISGRELHLIASDVFERGGYRTQRTGPGDDPLEGFQFSLGHGVGLEVHEQPWLGMGGTAQVVAGDVLAIEPGLWDRHVGMVRFEDLLLVTDDGHELLTDFPYDLRPPGGAAPGA
jgi:Xaa-Pro aminopeptidase